MNKFHFFGALGLSLLTPALSYAALDTTTMMADINALDSTVKDVLQISLGLIVAFALIKWVRRGTN